MFGFLNKLTKTEQNSLLDIEYTKEYINITLATTSASDAVVELYMNLFNELQDNNLAILEGRILKLKYESVYSLLEDEYASILMLPNMFSGKLEVKHRGFLDSDATFIIDFMDNGNLIHGITIFGSVLKISTTEHYILPHNLYKTLELINKANTSNIPSDRYIAIEYMQVNESDSLEYKGLLTHDRINTVKHIGLDILEDEKGNIDLLPLIPGMSTTDVKANRDLISSHSNESLLLTKTENGKIVRYVLDEKKLSGAKKISQIQSIPKDQVEAFKTNPEAFLPEFTESEIDVTQYRLNRIVGLTTEVYIGFFGSKQLETPMSQVLQPGGELVIAQMDKSEAINIIDSFSIEEKRNLEKSISEAKEIGLETIPLNGKECSVDILEKALQNNRHIDYQNSERKENSNLILDVKHNDDEADIDQVIRSHPDKIEITSKKIASHWQNLLYEPKEHQVTALNWLISLYQGKFPGGLLADDMGLGKTFQVISFFNYLYNVKTPKVDMKDKRILIVAPTILLSAWKNEIESAVNNKDSFRVKIIQGKTPALVDIGNLVKEFKTLDISDKVAQLANNNLNIINLLNHNIYITTYETLSSYQLAFAQQELFNFEVCIFDEAQKIKNPSARVSQAAKGICADIPFTIMVTGTPIENELRDLWSMFDTFDPNFIRSWKEFRETYVKPLTESNGNKIEMMLRKKVSNYMLRRLKKDHLQDLPKKEFVYLDIEMSEDEINQHNEIISGNIHHMDKLQKLRLLSLHPALLSIGKVVDPIELDRLTDPKEFFKPTKMQSLIKLLDKIKSNKEKVLIFVIRHSMQTLLQSALNQYYGLNIDIINGKNKGRDVVDSKLNAFSNCEGFNIMILSPLAAGVGLTITEANNVIHLERHWNPAKEDQASDRVYRIGQKLDVSIYHLVHTSDDVKTFDDGLNQLISSKKSLSDGTLIPTPSIKDSELVGTFFGTPEEEDRWELMSPSEFEIEIMSLYENAGYRCHITTKQPTESGTDIIAYKDGKTLAIQCKHTRNKTRQNNTALYQLISEAKLAYPDAKYIAITNYYFNGNAHRLAAEQNIILIEIDKILKGVIE